MPLTATICLTEGMLVGIEPIDGCDIQTQLFQLHFNLSLQQMVDLNFL